MQRNWLPKLSVTEGMPEQERLVVENIGLVYFVYGKMKASLPASMEPEDAISYGMIGLVQAAQRYEVEKGRFAPFAYMRIQGAILDGAHRYNWFHSTKVSETMLNQMVSCLEDEEILYIATESPEEDVLAKQDGEVLLQEIQRLLSPFDWDIIEGYYLNNQSFTNLSKQLGKSVSTISRHHDAALRKLRELLKNDTCI